jgi:hypothetical protein
MEETTMEHDDGIVNDGIQRELLQMIIMIV